ncbi:MAG: hypothetical protein B7Z64_06180, partial [Acidiphilium sp. 21-68-69]
RIRLHPQALAAAGLTSADVYNAVRSANATEPLGVIEGPHRAWTLVANGQISTAAQYRDIVLKSASGAILRLSDVASVIDGVANTQLSATANGRPAITIEITKTADANIIRTVEGIRKLLPDIRTWLPPSVKLSILNDRTTTIRASVADIQITLLITIMLVLVVVTLFMRRLTPTIAAGITVPLSLAGTVAAMWALGFTLDNFSLLALTVCVGFVVDDAIVMIENIVTQHERGLTGIEAALLGARQIGFTVVSITASLVVVFLPLTLMGGIIGDLFYEFAMTLSIAILISGVISLTVTPMICGRFMGRTPKAGRDSGPARAIDRLYRRSLDAYARSLDWALAHRWLMLASFALTVALTVFLYVRVPKAFIPEQDSGLIIGHTIAPSDVSFSRMKRLEGRVVTIILANPAVEAVSSRIGVANGFSTANRGHMFIQLKPLSQRGASAQVVLRQLQARLARIPGISTTMFVAQDLFFGGQSNGGEYSFSIVDPSLTGLADVTAEIERKLRTLKQIGNVSTDQDKAQTEITVAIDRKAAARLGVSSVTHLDGLPAGTISFNVAKGASLGQAIAAVKQAIGELPLPAEVKISFGGNARYFLQSLSTEPLLILAALVAIYIVLGVLYESLVQPLTILSTLPSAGVGALLALLLTGTPLSVIGIIGIFLLMGIVKKNGILLVDFALNAEREHGMTPAEAIRAACLERFRPIMMTTLAA